MTDLPLAEQPDYTYVYFIEKTTPKSNNNFSSERWKWKVIYFSNGKLAISTSTFHVINSFVYTTTNLN